MARKKIKNKEQTFEVSQEELQDYYSRYLPQYGPGGPFPATNPWFKIANLGNKLSNFKPGRTSVTFVAIYPILWSFSTSSSLIFDCCP